MLAQRLTPLARSVSGPSAVFLAQRLTPLAR